MVKNGYAPMVKDDHKNGHNNVCEWLRMAKIMAIRMVVRMVENGCLVIAKGYTPMKMIHSP